MARVRQVLRFSLGSTALPTPCKDSASSVFLSRRLAYTSTLLYMMAVDEVDVADGLTGI